MIRNIEIQKGTFHPDNHRRRLERPEVVTDRGGEHELSRASAPHLRKSSLRRPSFQPHFNILGSVKAIADSRCNDPAV